MKISKILPALWLIFALILAACAPQMPAATPTPAGLTLTDSLGRQVVLGGPAQRIVALGPTQTEILFAVGAGSQVVGRDTFSDYPAEAAALPDVGGGFAELNLEVILAQQPDLVLAGDLTPPEQIQALENAGLTVYVLADPAEFDGMYTGLRSVAQLSGHSAEAETLIASLQARVAAVLEKTASVAERPLVFYEIDGTDPAAVWTPGPESYIHQLIEMAGGENLGASLQGDYVQISLEELIARDPDLILLGDATWGGVTPEAVAARSGWETLSAVSGGRVYPFDDNLVSRSGPRTVDGLEALARFFHPQLFP